MCPLGISSWMSQRQCRLDKSRTEFIISCWLSVMGHWMNNGAASWENTERGMSAVAHRDAEFISKRTGVEQSRKIRTGSVQFSCSVVLDSLRPHEPQHARPPCPSPTPRVHPNPYLLSRWCHLTISSSVIPFSFCPQSFPASGSFQMSQLFPWGGQSIGVSASASVLPMNTQDWSPSEWTGGISL